MPTMFDSSPPAFFARSAHVLRSTNNDLNIQDATWAS